MADNFSVRTLFYSFLIFFLFCQKSFSNTFLPSDIKGKSNLTFAYVYLDVHQFYNSDGESDKIPDSSTITIQAVSFSYFFTFPKNILLGISLPFAINRTDKYFVPGTIDNSGLAQPSIGLRHLSDIGLGGSLDLILPLGEEDIVGPDPVASVLLGVYYFKTIKDFQLYTGIYTHLNANTGNNKRGPDFRIDLRPWYSILSKFRIYTMASLTIKTEDELNGFPVLNSDFRILNLGPGIDYSITDKIGFQAEADFGLLGKNAFGYRGGTVVGKVSF